MSELNDLAQWEAALEAGRSRCDIWIQADPEDKTVQVHINSLRLKLVFDYPSAKTLAEKILQEMGGEGLS